MVDIVDVWFFGVVGLVVKLKLRNVRGRGNMTGIPELWLSRPSDARTLVLHFKLQPTTSSLSPVCAEITPDSSDPMYLKLF